MPYAKELGLKPYGIAFHVGTQMEDVNAWSHPIKIAAEVFAEMKEEGIELEALDIGGGFPTRCRNDIPQYSEYGAAIYDALVENFGESKLPKEIMTEQGRFVSAMAGDIIVITGTGSYTTNMSTKWCSIENPTAVIER